MCAIVTEAEKRRLEKLLGGFKTLGEALRTLGRPDKTIPFGIAFGIPADGNIPPEFRYASVARYTRLSKVADIDLYHDPISGYTFSFNGKYLGKSHIGRKRRSARRG